MLLNLDCSTAVVSVYSSLELLLQSLDYSSLDYSAAVSLDIGYRCVCSVVSTCLDNAMKNYTAHVMHAIVAELKELHDVGFYVEMNGKKQHCILTQVHGDNLGLQSVLGFVENFSRATFPCDIYMATQEDVQTVFSDSATLARTPQLYTMHVKQLEQGLITVNDCGIKRSSALVSLPYYHPVSNDSTDVMHDQFEGVLPLEIKMLLCHLLYEVKCLTVT